MVRAATVNALIGSDDCVSSVLHGEGPSWCMTILLYYRQTTEVIVQMLLMCRNVFVVAPYRSCNMLDISTGQCIMV